MVTEQSHIPIGAWPSGKIFIGPMHDPQIMKTFQMQVRLMRNSYLPHCGCHIEHSAYWCLIFNCLSKLTSSRTLLCNGSAIESTFQATGIVLHFVTCAGLCSDTCWNSSFSAVDHCINRIKCMDDLRIHFYFHRMPLRHHSLTEVSDKITCKQV